MANSSDSGKTDSWPGFLAELTKSFLILRDVFGYALLGAVFLSTGLLCRRFSLHDVQYYLLDPYKPPAWLAVIVGLGACYAVGHVMAAIAYLPYNFKKKSPAPTSPTVSAQLIDIRGRHPELLIELERQSTMTQLRGSTGVALVLGSVLFCWCPTPPLRWMLAVAGAFLCIVFWSSAMPHLDVLQRDTVEAAKLTDASSTGTQVSSATLKQTLQNLINAATEALKNL